MDILIGVLFAIAVSFIIPAISDAKAKAKYKRMEEERIRERNLRLAELSKQREEQEKKRLEEECKQLEEQRKYQEKVQFARDNDPALYFQLILSDYQISTFFSDGILGIDASLPTKKTIRNLHKADYLKTDGSVKAQLDKDLPKLYETHLYRLCLKTINDAFVMDNTGLAHSIVYNGFVDDYNLSNGKLEKSLVLSILVSRDSFNEIDMAHVDPKKCFKALKGVSAAKLVDIVPVQPVLQFDKNDHRFIESKDVTTNTGTNIAAMPWEDFEQLVREIFEIEFAQNGGEVRVTQASRDGGVDAVIFDPDPLRGGKIVVQAKRYTNTVPISAIRDLYGTVINEGANTGIIITTSDYGRDSYEFAKDKPLKLLNGGHLLALLNKNGRKGYINLTEAKNITTEEKISFVK